MRVVKLPVGGSSGQDVTAGETAPSTERLTMGTTRPPPDARSALLECAATILSAARETGVVPEGACLIVAVGDADTAVVLANGNALAAERMLRSISGKTPEILTAIHRQTGN